MKRRSPFIPCASRAVRSVPGGRGADTIFIAPKEELSMLRKLLMASAVLAAASTPALAQAPGSYDWSGFYVGVNAGYGGNQFSYPITGDLAFGPITESLDSKVDLTSSGFVGGGQLGFNWEYPGGWLFGLETDLDGSGIEGRLKASGAVTGLLSGAAELSAGSQIDYLGTVRARLGVVTSRDLLVYGTAGFAYGEVKSRYDVGVTSGGSTLFSAAGSTSETNTGWTAGAGAEYPITDDLTLKAEYLYVDLGDQTLISTPFALLGATGHVGVGVETTAHIVRVGLNYRFD